jgi:hypothetical protein
MVWRAANASDRFLRQSAELGLQWSGLLGLLDVPSQTSQRNESYAIRHGLRVLALNITEPQRQDPNSPG